MATKDDDCYEPVCDKDDPIDLLRVRRNRRKNR